VCWVEQDEGTRWGGRRRGLRLRREGNRQWRSCGRLCRLRRGRGLSLCGPQRSEAAEEEQDSGDGLLPGRSQWDRYGNSLIVIGGAEGIAEGRVEVVDSTLRKARRVGRGWERGLAAGREGRELQWNRVYLWEKLKPTSGTRTWGTLFWDLVSRGRRWPGRSAAWGRSRWTFAA
jgi:hypothetical protein